MEPAKRSSHVAAAFHQLRRPALLLLLLLVIMAGALSGRSTADQVLDPGDSLYTGQSLTESTYVLIMQANCNLVFSDDGVDIWSTGTGGSGSNCHATMQHDGVLVVYNGEGKPVWASGTPRPTGDYVLVLQRNGKVRIYGPATWGDIGTNVPGGKASVPKDDAAVALTSSPSLSSTHAAGSVVGGGGRKAATAVDAGEGSKN